MFVFGYGVCRIVAECFRQPDPFLGYLAGGLTMGQILSIPMLMIGAGLICTRCSIRGWRRRSGRRWRRVPAVFAPTPAEGRRAADGGRWLVPGRHGGRIGAARWVLG